MIRVLPIQAEHKDQLFELMKYLLEHEYSRAQFDKSFDLIVNNPNYYLLGAINHKNQLMGSVMGLLSSDLKADCRPMLFMENMVVHPDFRSLGVGKLLLEALEQIGRQQNCFFIEFCSGSQRTEAHRFYEEKMGYDAGMVKGYRKFL